MKSLFDVYQDKLWFPLLAGNQSETVTCVESKPVDTKAIVAM